MIRLKILRKPRISQYFGEYFPSKQINRKLLAYESVKMVGIYFSGIGNSEYAAELEDM